MPEEKRIYVVVAEKVKSTAAPFANEIVQPAGRIAAQVGHVVSKVRVAEIAADTHRAPYFQPFTTIVLSARNSTELDHVVNVLGLGKIDHETFVDTNTEYGYGDDHQLLPVMTAVATYPIDPTKVKGLLDHLPLWRPNCG